MNEEFQKVFFEEFNGIDARFRDGIYNLGAEEIATVKNWVNDVSEQAKNSNNIELHDVKDIVRVIEVLEKSPEEDSFWLRQHIFAKIENI